MSEEKLMKEVDNAEMEKVQKIVGTIQKIENKNSKFLFCVPDIDTPSALIYEIFFHATVVKKMGYKTIMLTENGEYKPPYWMEKELLDHEFVPMNNNRISVGPEDIMIISETHSNVMEQTKNLPCIRVGLLQSIDYKLNSLIPGTDWSSFGIKRVITTSETLKEFMEVFYGKNKYNIKLYDIGIPDYFKKSEKPQKPIISIVGRNSNDVSKIVKMFYSRFPQYTWVTFDPMLTHSKPPKQMRRVDFANRLKENFAAVWVDRISSFGTFPLECMKSGTIPICLKPDVTPDYLVKREENDKEKIEIIDGAGVWTNDFYDIPILIGELLVKYLDDSLGEEIYQKMDEVSSYYTQERSEKQLSGIYSEILDERKDFLQKTVDELTKNEKK